MSKKSMKVPEKMRDKYDEIVAVTDDFCASHLNEEYAELARYAAAGLSRKRPSPLVRGDVGSWACSIIYALGQMNDLFYGHGELQIEAGELCDLFDVSTSTGGRKAKQIRDWLKMDKNYADWMLSYNIENDIRVWLLEVDGFIVDIREEPRWLQKIAHEQGAIPYIPADGPPDE